MAPNGNGRNGVRWPVLISAGSLILGLIGGGAAVIKGQLNSLRDAAASDRQLLRSQIDRIDAKIPPAGELNYRDQVLQAQINSLNERLDRTEQQLHQLQQRGR